MDLYVSRVLCIHFLDFQRADATRVAVFTAVGADISKENFLSLENKKTYKTVGCGKTISGKN